MERIVGMIDKVLINADDEKLIGDVKNEVKNLCNNFLFILN